VTTTAAAPTGTAVDQRLPRLESLTGLRWWAAFAVFVHHFMNFAALPRITEISVFGTTGVTFFFILSGFVLTWSHTDHDTAPRFYWRRFARIWPLHLVATLIAIPVFYGTADSFQKPFDLTAIVLSLLLVHAWSYSTPIFFGGNPASWSLSDEAFFYAGFPFVVRRLLGRKALQLALVAFACIALTWGLYALFRYVDSSIVVRTIFTHSPLYRCLEFVLGVCVAAAIRGGWRTRVPVNVAILLLAAAVLGLAVWARHPEWTDFARPIGVANQVTGPFYALLIAAVASHDIRAGGSWLSRRPLVALGKWSYAFYLVHATVVYAFRLAFGQQPRGWDNLGWMVVVLAVSIALSAALYLLVEHPVERRLRALLPARRELAHEPATADDPPR
jgi:peptidoglycan/LPS O-acetylase OafA/YrhL